MATDYVQTGNMKTVVKLNLAGEKLDTSWGSWRSTPVEKVDGDGKGHDIFKCVNLYSYACGPEGTVTYESSDGSVFTLHFDCPSSSANVCDAEVSGSSPFKISASVPAHGFNITYSWVISQKDYNQIIDLPVSSADFIAARKCDLVPFNKIMEYINGREKLTLKDVFAIKELPDRAKIWCATHPLFLTDQSKAVLTRELAKRAAGKLKGVYDVGKLLEDALAYNDKLSQLESGLSLGKKLNSEISSLISRAISAEPTKYENVLLCALQALTIEDLSEGFKAAVAAFVNEREQNGLDDRFAEAVAIIGEKLCL